jgi:Recombination endonuclease VII
MKKCTECCLEKDESRFSKKRSGLNTRCKECIGKYMKHLYAKDRPKELEKRKAWYRKNQARVKREAKNRYASNKEDIKFRRIFLKYGLTKEGYENLLAEQNGTCAVCKLPNSFKSFAVDHNHITLAVRGLLCDKCNTALGLLDEDIERMASLISYVKKYQK